MITSEKLAVLAARPGLSDDIRDALSDAAAQLTAAAMAAAVERAGVDTQVIAAAKDLGGEGQKNPEWAFIDYEANQMSFGRWAKCGPNPAPYVRLDLLLNADGLAEVQARDEGAKP